MERERERERKREKNMFRRETDRQTDYNVTLVTYQVVLTFSEEKKDRETGRQKEHDLLIHIV